MSAATTAAAIVGAGALGAGAQIYSSNQAASAQEKAANQANATEQGFFNQTQQNLQPYIAEGNAAGQKIESLEGLTGGPNTSQQTLASLPGYQFALQQGLKSTQNSATARGLGVSGAALKGADTYSTGLANSYYNNLLTGLQSTNALGANAAAGLASNATQTGSNIASNQLGAGNAQAGNDLLSGSAVGSIGNGLITSSLLQNFQNQNGTGIVDSSPDVFASGAPAGNALFGN